LLRSASKLRSATQAGSAARAAYLLRYGTNLTAFPLERQACNVRVVQKHGRNSERITGTASGFSG
jgi:hypothetical protein